MQDMLYVVLIVLMAVGANVIRTIVKNKNKRLELQHNMLKDEIKLEEIKQKNYLLENEKLRLELQQIQSNTSTKAELLDFKQLGFGSGIDSLSNVDPSQPKEAGTKPD